MERYTSRPDAYFVKSNVEPHESFMHKYIYNLKIDGINMPRLVTYNKKTSQLVMANIDGMSVSDMYGENIEDTPDDVFEKIREILVKLVDNGIEYPDFTGYNFILDNNVPDKIWVIDFEHTTCVENITNKCIMGVYNGEKMWNDDYK
jgi:tRNA A-37 threonylcarbamoyl transferase component Bud32